MITVIDILNLGCVAALAALQFNGRVRINGIALGVSESAQFMLHSYISMILGWNLKCMAVKFDAK